MTDSENINEELFLGQNFYIYPTRRLKEVQWLQNFIEKYGGFSVFYSDPDDERLDKHHEGFALIDPSELYAPRFLRAEYILDPDTKQPVLFYLNWGYPLLCVQADKMVKPEKARELLTLNRLPYPEGGWTIFFSRSYQDQHPEKMKRNARRVSFYGGILVEDESEASIVIAPDEHLPTEREQFKRKRNTRIESYKWFIDTMALEYVEFTRPIIKPVPGRPTADRRNGRPIRSFNNKEDRHLIEYLAYQSNPSGVGRQGNNIYKMLCESGEYSWANRHTWHSWRTRYKGRKDWFDEEIRKYIKENPTAFTDSHGIYLPTGTPGELSERGMFRKKNANNRVIVSEDEDDQPPVSQPTRKTANEKERNQEAEHNAGEKKNQSKATRPKQNLPDSSDEEQEVPSRNAKSSAPTRKRSTMDTNGSFEAGVAHMPSSTPPRREREVSGTQTTLVDHSAREPQPDEDDQPASVRSSSRGVRSYHLHGLENIGDEDTEAEEDELDEEDDKSEGDEEESDRDSDEGEEGSHAENDNGGGEDKEDTGEESPQERDQDEEDGRIAPDAPPEGLSFLSAQLSAQEEAEVTRILDESDAIPGGRRTLEGTKEREKPFELEVMDDPNIPAVEFVVGSPSRSGRKAKTDSKLKATPRTHDKAKTTLLRMNTRSQARNVET